MIDNLEFVARVLVVVALVYAVTVAATAWAVRSRRLNAFGLWPRLVRKASDPVLRPLERRVVRFGGNPQDASLWLIGIVVAGGLLLVSLVQWLIGVAYTVGALGPAGPRAWLRFGVNALFSLMMLALLIRVIASWLAVSPYSAVMRPIMVITNWLIEPIRRLLPPTGMVDFSPMVAWLLLWLARGVVMGML